MPVSSYTNSNLADSAQSSSRYPNPFFDLANNSIPKNIKTLFKYCHSFFHTDPFLSNVVRKLTEYPITELLYETSTDVALRKKYDTILHEKLDINRVLIEIGLDYFTYGNCFISIFSKFKRYLVNTQTGMKYPIDTVKYRYYRHKFWVKENGIDVECTIEDEPIVAIEALRLVRWNPDNIDIDYDPINGESRYFYNIPPDTRKKILAGDEFTLKNTPAVFLEAIQKKQKVELDQKTFYHFKRPGLSESDMGWGKPMILPALKKIYYLQLLQKGNEAIAHEHVVPKKSIAPAGTGSVDPLSQMNMPKWVSQMEGTVKKWKKDPNYIAVFPIPITYQELGGNARSLMLTPELKFLEEIIINSLGVPLEFIKGGASWTGSSISLRIVENMFLTYRQGLINFLNHFLVPKLTMFLKYPAVKLKFKEFRMADDPQTKQLVLQLAEMGKLSDEKLLDSYGYVPEEVQTELNSSRDSSRKNSIEDMKSQAIAQGEAGVIAQVYGIRGQMAAQREQIRERLTKLQAEVQKEQGSVSLDYVTMVEQMALQVMFMPPEQQLSYVANLARTMPVTHSIIMETVQMYQNAGVMPMGNNAGPGNPQSATNPPNKKSPGDRESNKVKPEPEKTKGNTRGVPR